MYGVDLGYGVGVRRTDGRGGSEGSVVTSKAYDPPFFVDRV